MSNVAQKRPFASLIEDEPIESTPPPSPPQHSIPQPVLMTLAEKKWCSQTIKSLKKHKRAIAFLDPVDPIQFNIPDYFDIIKKPMDLGTVEKKLTAEKYPTVEAFKADVQLVFDNCYLYNNPGDPVCLDAKKLEEQYHKLCKKEPSVLATMKANSQPIPTLTENTTNPIINNNLQASPTIKSTTITISTKPKNVSSAKVPTSHNNSITNEEIIKTPPESTISSLKTESNDKVELMPEDQFKRCEAIVKELKKPKYQGINWPFINPVDAAAWGATDYYEIIKQPMDMATYERKLYEFEYSSENELLEDIRLMFRNCYTYNPPNHLVHNLGKEFEQAFEKQWAKIYARSQNKKPSTSTSTSSVSKHPAKKQRTSLSDISSSRPIIEEPLPLPLPATINTAVSENPSVIYDDNMSIDPLNDNVNNQASTPMSTTSSVASNNNTPNSGRSTILRLKLSVKPKEEEPPKPKPVKIPGLALSKEPPSATANGPKLAIGGKPTSPIKEKKTDKSTPIVLHNHDKWLALAKKSPPDTSTPSRSHQLPPSQPQKKPKEVISPITKPKEPVALPPPPAPPVAAAFDINDLYNKIHNEKKLKEQKKREEQEKWEKNERLRLEKEKLASEERMKQIREFNQHLQIQRQKDKKQRLNDLDAHKIDISRQKMTFAKFESSCMARDQDWREIYTWQRDTIDYRHIPVPGFVKRAPIKLPELRKRLLSKCVRLENSKSINSQVQTMEDDGGSDMDVE